MWADELKTVSDTAEGMIELSPSIRGALAAAITGEIRNIEDICRGMDSSSTLEDHAEALKVIGPRAGVPDNALTTALDHITERITEIEEYETISSEAPSFSAPDLSDHAFSDEAMDALFSGLKA